MRIILLGAPGSGKGTQGTVLAEHFGVRHVASGELLRAHIAQDSEVGREARGYVERGVLVPDDLVLQMVGGAVVDAAQHGGYILDGFPRTIEQAERAYELAPADATADAAVFLDVPDDVVRERMLARREGRVDDADPEVVDRRMRVFHEQTEPLLGFYGDRGILVVVDAARPPADVTEATLAALGQR